MKSYKYVIALVLGLGLAPSVQGATPYEQYVEEDVNRRAFEQQDWKKAIEGLNYEEPASQKKRREEAEQRKRQEGQHGERYEAMRREPGFGMSSQLGSAILKFLAILLIAVVVAILLRAILGLEMAPRNKKIRRQGISGPINLDEIEENIHETDLDAYIRQALAEGDYVLAIRLYYLAILKELSLKKAIRWKKDKTNRQYLQEMQQSALAVPFGEATRFFEQAWYGGRPVGESEYRQMEPTFRELVDKAKA